MRDSVVKHVSLYIRKNHLKEVQEYLKRARAFDSQAGDFKRSLYIKAFQSVVKQPVKKITSTRAAKSNPYLTDFSTAVATYDGSDC